MTSPRDAAQVALADLVEHLRDQGEPAFAAAVEGFRTCTEHELVDHVRSSFPGMMYSYLIDPPIHARGAVDGVAAARRIELVRRVHDASGLNPDDPSSPRPTRSGPSRLPNLDDAVTALGGWGVVSDAVVVWTGHGTPLPERAAAEPPMGDVAGLEARFGPGLAAELECVVERVFSAFYRSEPNMFTPTAARFERAVTARVRDLHPGLSSEAVDALAWCYLADLGGRCPSHIAKHLMGRYKTWTWGDPQRRARLLGGAI